MAARHDHSGGRTPDWGSAAGGPSDRLPETGFLTKTRFLTTDLAGKVDGLYGVQSNNYWSSTSNADNPNNAWNVNLNDGNADNDHKNNDNYVWPVRGGE